MTHDVVIIRLPGTLYRGEAPARWTCTCGQHGPIEPEWIEATRGGRAHTDWHKTGVA